MVWNRKSIEVSDCLMGKFSLSIKIKKGNGVECWFSGIYGPYRPRNRMAL